MCGSEHRFLSLSHFIQSSSITTSAGIASIFNPHRPPPAETVGDWMCDRAADRWRGWHPPSFPPSRFTPPPGRSIGPHRVRFGEFGEFGEFQELRAPSTATVQVIDPRFIDNGRGWSVPWGAPRRCPVNTNDRWQS